MMMRKIKKWIESNPLIRAAILTGSRAEHRETDDFSDYDIALICSDSRPFLQSNEWLEEIAPVWVSIPERFFVEETMVPTRLVIFEGGKKVDFAFYPLDMFPDELSMGYEVLLDKDQLTENLPNPTYEGFKTERPSEEEFHDLINEFWFEVYHVAKYLQRQDLWSVQFRLSGIHHNFLIRTICWNEAAKHDWNYTTHPIGKRMQEWASGEIWSALHQVFPHFDTKDGWEALERTMDLFEKLTRETAASLGYGKLPELENSMRRFVNVYAERF